MKTLHSLSDVLKAQDEDRLYCWTESPFQPGDPEWYEAHWHPCTSHGLLLDGADLRKLAAALDAGEFATTVGGADLD